MQEYHNSNSVISALNLIWIGVGLAILYWLLESFMHITVFGDGLLLEHVFTPDIHEIWKRLLVSGLIVTFSIYAQSSINIRRRTEMALADRERELSRILENNPAGIILVDADSRKISWANSNALKLIGASKEVIENRVCHQYLCPTETGNCPILDNDRTIDLSERTLLTSTGGTLPILKSVSRVQYNGREHLLESFFDLSDRKKMERDLKQAHAELEQIFQTAAVAMRLVDLDFNVLKINDTFERLTNVKKAAAFGKKCHEIFSGPTCFKDKCPIESVKNGREMVECYVDKRRPDGKIIPCILNATPFIGPEGTVIGIVESFRDITELKKAWNAIESERDKLDRILYHLHDGVSIINGSFIVEYQNRVFDAYFGDCGGKSCHAAIHGMAQPCDPCLMKVAAETGQIQQGEFGTPDGRSFEKAYTPVTDVDNQQKVVALWRDITEKKATMAAIMRAEQLAALGELAAGVAHEINNPINGIINYAQIIVNRTTGDTHLREIGERLIKEGDRIARIVEGLLSFSRRKRDDKTIVSIEEILAESIALTAAQLRKDNIVVSTALAEHLPDIKAQAHEIEQVFVNIISNARHALNKKFPHTHEDKILKITAAPVSAKGQPFVQVCFEDHGCGIPPGVIGKVMNPFFSTKNEGKRTGLGLSISHGIVEEHGGRLRLESEEGAFTRVFLELPVHQATDQ